VVNVMKEDAALVTLVKPQFEAQRSQVRIMNSYYGLLLFILIFPAIIYS
jgi:predicted rRNA methylase YqxC with S4 and FtsJ domains